MESTRTSGRVTSSTGDVDPNGEIVGYRGAGTMIDPGRYTLREGLHERLVASATGVTPELVAEQLAGIRRMLTGTAVA